MSMVLTDSPSAGQSEVIETMRRVGALGRTAITVARLQRAVAQRYRIHDASHAAAVLTVLQTLAAASKVTPSPTLQTDLVKLTVTGNTAARHARGKVAPYA